MSPSSRSTISGPNEENKREGTTNNSDNHRDNDARQRLQQGLSGNRNNTDANVNTNANANANANANTHTKHQHQ